MTQTRLRTVVTMLAAGVWMLHAGNIAAQSGRSTPASPLNPFPAAYDVKGLRLATDVTVAVAFASRRCEPCNEAIPFFRELLKLPGMDGKRKKLVIVATDGLWPVSDVLEKFQFVPHGLTSGPYPARTLPGITTTPAILLLDAGGTVLGTWQGPLTAAHRSEIVAAIRKGAPAQKRKGQ